MPELFNVKTPVKDPEADPDFKKDTAPLREPGVAKPPARFNRGMLSAFMVRPAGIRFETQEAKEEILLFMRQHPVINIGWIAVTVGLIILPWIITPLIMSTHLLPSGIPPGYFIILPLLWYVGTAGYAFTNFLRWYYNVYIVTNERIVDVDWVSLLYKQISSALLSKIQDVTYKQSGILDSFFDYGIVLIQTAGKEENFEFDLVPKPDQIVKEIDRILESINPQVQAEL